MTMKDLRNSLKLSQRAFAEQLGVTTAAVSRIENGQMMISDRIADKIWELYGVDVRDVSTVKKPKRKTGETGNFHPVSAGRKYYPGRNCGQNAGGSGNLLCAGGPEPDLVGSRI